MYNVCSSQSFGASAWIWIYCKKIGPVIVCLDFAAVLFFFCSLLIKTKKIYCEHSYSYISTRRNQYQKESPNVHLIVCVCVCVPVLYTIYGVHNHLVKCDTPNLAEKKKAKCHICLGTLNPIHTNTEIKWLEIKISDTRLVFSRCNYHCWPPSPAPFSFFVSLCLRCSNFVIFIFSE